MSSLRRGSEGLIQVVPVALVALLPAIWRLPLASRKNGVVNVPATFRWPTVAWSASTSSATAHAGFAASSRTRAGVALCHVFGQIADVPGSVGDQPPLYRA